MNYIKLLFLGALICNSIPHLAAGSQGHPFPTPFAKPRGIGNSPPWVNFLWGSANLFLGLFLLWRYFALAETPLGATVSALGFLALGFYLSRHFGRVLQNARADASPQPLRTP